MNNTHRNNAGGFTLVELLVVISIIAILLAVMMPALAKARSAAGAAICGSNQKQQSVVQFTFASGNNGKFPQHFANRPQYYLLKPSTVNNLANRTDIYDTYKSFIGSGNIFVCPVTAKLALANGNKTNGYYKSASWNETTMAYSWWYGGWDAKFAERGGGVNPSQAVRGSPYLWYANWRYVGRMIKVKGDAGITEADIVVASKADKWAITQADLKASAAFITHDVGRTGGTVGSGNISDWGHGAKVGGPKTSSISKLERGVNPTTLGDGSVAKIPTSELKLRAWYKETTSWIELYW